MSISFKEITRLTETLPQTTVPNPSSFSHPTLWVEALDRMRTDIYHSLYKIRANTKLRILTDSTTAPLLALKTNQWKSPILELKRFEGSACPFHSAVDNSPDLFYTAVDNKELAEILAAANTNLEISSFKIYDLKFDDAGAALIADFIRSTERITEINIQNTKFTGKGLCIIARALAQNTSVAKVQITSSFEMPLGGKIKQSLGGVDYAGALPWEGHPSEWTAFTPRSYAIACREVYQSFIKTANKNPNIHTIDLFISHPFSWEDNDRSENFSDNFGSLYYAGEGPKELSAVLQSEERINLRVKRGLAYLEQQASGPARYIRPLIFDYIFGKSASESHKDIFPTPPPPKSLLLTMPTPLVTLTPLSTPSPLATPAPLTRSSLTSSSSPATASHSSSSSSSLSSSSSTGVILMPSKGKTKLGTETVGSSKKHRK